MKKIFLNLSVIAVMGLTFTACSNEEANKKAKEADDAAVQALVQEKLANIDAEVATECDAKVLAAAQPIVDSLNAAKAAGKKVTVPVVKKPTKPVTKPATPKQEPAKPATVGTGKPSMTGGSSTTVGSGKPSMTAPANDGKNNTGGSSTVGSGKPKL